MTQLVIVYVMLFVISLLANGLSALAGGGAGLLQLPALLFLGLNFAPALATHKIASVALGVGATYRHLKGNTVSLKFSLFMLLAGLPGVVLGANIILQIPDTWSQGALGMLTLGLGLYSVFSPQLGMMDQTAKTSLWHYLVGGLGLFCIGILNGSITSGTGLFVTIWLVVWFGMAYRSAVAYTLILVGMFWNGTGALVVAVQSPPQWDWLPSLVLGALAGGYIGAHWSIAKGSGLVKRCFEVLTMVVGLSLLWRAIYGPPAL